MEGRVSAPAHAGASFCLRVPPEGRYGRYVRERVSAFAQTHAIPQADAAEFVTAVSEALANAVEHSQSADTIEVSCRLVGGDQLVATVVDYGIGFALDDVAEPRLPEPLAERGRGLPIMRSYTDVLSVQSAPGKGTSVLLGRYIGRRDGFAQQPAAGV